MATQPALAIDYAPQEPHAKGTPDNVRTISPRRRELKLAAAIASGDEAAFERLHRAYRDRVYAFALKRTRDAAEAEDICQDVFIQVFRCIGSFEGRSSLLTWLFGITHHQICRRLRKRRLESFSLDAPGVMEASSEDVPVDRRVDAARLLRSCDEVLEGRVTESQREIFRLRYADNYSIKEIAESLGKSRQAVKISLFRARRTLAAELEERGLALPGRDDAAAPSEQRL